MSILDDIFGTSSVHFPSDGYVYRIVMKSPPGVHKSHSATTLTIRDGFVYIPEEGGEWTAFNLSEVKSISRVKV